MKTIYHLLAATAATACSALLPSQAETSLEPVTPTNSAAVIRVACVGDSITYGHGASDRTKTAYPAQLQSLMGEGWEILNFGHNARTALDEGREWNGRGGQGYRKSPNFAKALACQPDVVLFMLGTNDSKPVNWDGRADDVKRDYARLVDDFLALKPAPVVIIATSPFVKKDSFSIREKIVGGELVPWQRSFASARALPLVDAYSAMKDAAAKAYIGDGVHPNDAGYGVLAATFATKLRELAPTLRVRDATRSNPVTALTPDEKTEPHSHP